MHLCKCNNNLMTKQYDIHWGIVSAQVLLLKFLLHFHDYTHILCQCRTFTCNKVFVKALNTSPLGIQF